MKDTFAEALEVIADCGHEIGFHVNAIAEALRTNGDPVKILADELDELQLLRLSRDGCCGARRPSVPFGRVRERRDVHGERPSVLRSS
jgi:hypothetical protein